MNSCSYLVLLTLSLVFLFSQNPSQAQIRFYSPDIPKYYIMNTEFVKEKQEYAAIPLIVFDRESDALEDDRSRS